MEKEQDPIGKELLWCLGALWSLVKFLLKCLGYVVAFLGVMLLTWGGIALLVSFPLPIIAFGVILLVLNQF